MNAKLTFLGLLFQAGLLVSICSAPALGGTCVVKPNGLCDTQQLQRVPLKIYRNFLVVAEGQIGGIPDRLNFVLDTGTAPSAISQKLAQRLGLGTTPSSTLALGTRVSVRASTLSEIDLGPIRALSLPVLIKDLSRLEKDMGIQIAGIIGMDVLSKSNFHLDYDKKELEFGDISHEGVPIPFDARAGIALADVRLGGKFLRMLVDTGSEYVVLLGGNLGETGLPVLRETSQSGVSVADQKMRVQEFSAPDIMLGGRHFSDETVFLVPGSSDPVFDGLLSVRALGFRSLSYDRAYGTMFLQ